MVSFTCPNCDGSGESRYSIVHLNTGFHEGVRDTCRVCNGSGSMKGRRDSPMVPDDGLEYEDWRDNR